MMRLELELLGHVGNDIGLADGLPAGDRQRLVCVGLVAEVARYEMLPRYLVHGPQQSRIRNPPLAKEKQEMHTTNTIVTGRLLRHAGLALVSGFPFRVAPAMASVTAVLTSF